MKLKEPPDFHRAALKKLLVLLELPLQMIILGENGP